MNRLLGCNIYISEGHNLRLIRQLEVLCRQHPKAVLLANTFVDAPYHRTGLTVVAASIPELAATVTAVAQQAVSCLDLRTHQALHPRLGVLDHVSIHPLGHAATLQLAAQAAQAVGQRLAAPPLQLPVYYYGAAHPAGRRLADIRRQLSYFRPSTTAANTPGGNSNPVHNKSSSSISSSNTTGSDSLWAGTIQQIDLSSHPPDAGPLVVPAAAGVVTIGAVPWVMNFNVPLYTDDLAAAKAIARAVSTRGGGLPGVEAMALRHNPGVIEVATNLIAYDWREAEATSGHAAQPSGSSSALQQPKLVPEESSGAGPSEVATAIAACAAEQGLTPPGPGYVTNKQPAELLLLAAQHWSQV